MSSSDPGDGCPSISSANTQTDISDHLHVLEGFHDLQVGLALVLDDRTLTFAEFDREATQVAHALAAAGVGNQDRVGFIGKNEPNSVAIGAFTPESPSQAACFEVGDTYVSIAGESVQGPQPDQRVREASLEHLGETIPIVVQRGDEEIEFQMKLNETPPALGVGVALWALGQLGYVPNVIQSDTVKLAIRVTYILVPVACYTVAFIIAWRYPLNREMHARIRAEIDARRGEVPA